MEKGDSKGANSVSSSPCIKSVDERGHMHSKWVTEDEPKSSPSAFDESNAKPEYDPFLGGGQMHST